MELTASVHTCAVIAVSWHEVKHLGMLAMVLVTQEVVLFRMSCCPLSQLGHNSKGQPHSTKTCSQRQTYGCLLSAHGGHHR